MSWTNLKGMLCQMIICLTDSNDSFQRLSGTDSLQSIIVLKIVESAIKYGAMQMQRKLILSIIIAIKQTR